MTVANAQSDRLVAIPPAQLTTAHISDIAGDYVTLSREIVPVWHGARIIDAPAMTVQVAPGDNTSLFEAIDAAEPGCVLVVNGNGYLGRALWGALMSFAAMQRGLVGVVVDGLVRDREELENIAFPAFARGVTPVAPRPTMAGRLNVPIMCGGLLVSPGDYVFGDADGVVIISSENRDAVLAAAWARVEAENLAFERLRAGESLLDVRASGILKTPIAAATSSPERPAPRTGE